MVSGPVKPIKKFCCTGLNSLMCPRHEVIEVSFQTYASLTCAPRLQFDKTPKKAIPSVPFRNAPVSTVLHSKATPSLRNHRGVPRKSDLSNVTKRCNSFTFVCVEVTSVCSSCVRSSFRRRRTGSCGRPSTGHGRRRSCGG